MRAEYACAWAVWPQSTGHGGCASCRRPRGIFQLGIQALIEQELELPAGDRGGTVAQAKPRERTTDLEAHDRQDGDLAQCELVGGRGARDDGEYETGRDALLHGLRAPDAPDP